MSATELIPEDQVDRPEGRYASDKECLRKPGTTRQSPMRGRFLTNLISNVGLFSINIIVGLWYTPYLIHHLGEGGYGIVPLVTQIVTYLEVITVGLNAAVGRYITIAIEAREEDAANRYLNPSFFGIVFAAFDGDSHIA